MVFMCWCKLPSTHWTTSTAGVWVTLKSWGWSKRWGCDLWWSRGDGGLERWLNTSLLDKMMCSSSCSSKKLCSVKYPQGKYNIIRLVSYSNSCFIKAFIWPGCPWAQWGPRFLGAARWCHLPPKDWSVSSPACHLGTSTAKTWRVKTERTGPLCLSASQKVVAAKCLQHVKKNSIKKKFCVKYCVCVRVCVPKILPCKVFSNFSTRCGISDVFSCWRVTMATRSARRRSRRAQLLIKAVPSLWQPNRKTMYG